MLVSFADMSMEDQIPIGALWALCGAILYALYLVSVKHPSHIYIVLSFSIGGIVLVSFADMSMEDQIPIGALWALCGAILYALYLVSLRRKVDHEDKLDIPMFFGEYCMHYISSPYVAEWTMKTNLTYPCSSVSTVCIISRLPTSPSRP